MVRIVVDLKGFYEEWCLSSLRRYSDTPNLTTTLPGLTALSLHCTLLQHLHR